jgi:arylsulfatase A-like enzyme
MLRAAVAAALCLAPALAAQRANSEDKAAAGTRPNLLLLTLDTTRADEVAPWGAGGVAQNLDRLASESLVAAIARAPAPLTLPSHASMMTGLFPFAHGVRDNDLYRLSPRACTVARVLHETGWRTEAVVAATVLRAGSGLDLGFERYDDLHLRRARNLAIEAERPADQVTDVALARLAVADPRPWFLWVHYYDPHFPYAAPGGPPPSAGRRAAYEAEVRFMDREIGRLLDALRTSGALARTWIVVCGDHGEGLGIQQELTHAYLCEEGTLRVPLFVRRPDGALRGRVATAASTADVGPTLLGAVGLAFPGAVHGRSLLAAFEEQQRGDADPSEERTLWIETCAGYHQFRWARLEGVIAGRWKYVRNVEDELFDLGPPPADPPSPSSPLDPPASLATLEKRNLARERPEIVQALKNRAEALIGEPVARVDSAAPSLDPAEAARLRELGYLARMVGEDDERDRGDLDPRLHYQSYLDLDLATALAQQGKFEESLAKLTKLAGDYPRNPGFREFLGKVELEAGRRSEAKAAFEQALALDKELVSATFYLGVVALQSGDRGEARRRFERTLLLAPGHLEARLQLRALRDAEHEPEAILDDCLDVLAICDEMGDADAKAIASGTLDEWLTKLLPRLAGAPDRAAVFARARARIPADAGAYLRRAAALLDTERAPGH